jgi:hypothetical protein
MKDQTDFASAASPWKRPWFVVSAVFLGLVVAAAIFIVATGPDDEPTTAPLSPAATSGAVGQPSQSLPSAVPTVPPAGVTWQLVGEKAVPVSAEHGPRTVSGGTAAGYTHTPEGALLAASQIVARSGHAAGKASWEPTVEKQFMEGPDRDRLLANLRSVPEAQPAPGDLSPLMGYLYQSYTPDTAVIGLVYRSPGTGGGPTQRHHILTTTVLWRDGDWKMQPPPGGSWLSVNRQATDLTGVVKWGSY